MRPSLFADAVIAAEKARNGHSLAQLFAIGGPFASGVMMELGDPRPNKIVAALRKCSGYLVSPWEEMCQQHLLALYYYYLAGSLQAYANDSTDGEGKTRSERMAESFEAYNTVVTAFLRYFASLVPGRWAVPLLRILCLNLRWLAVQADAAAVEASTPAAPTRMVTPSGAGVHRNAAATAAAAGSSTGSSGSSTGAEASRTSSLANRRLEESARQLNKAFTACIADRNPDVHESRKWGTYEVVGMVFKTYFRLKSISLCRNILRAISAGGLPSLDEFPMSQQVTYRYYVGVLAFLGEEYDKAEHDLQFAFDKCHRTALHNREMILTYLIPVKLLAGSLPAPALLQAFPKLQAIYSPFLTAYAKGDIKSFDTALIHPHREKLLVRKGTYIAMEKVREACLRTLFKKVWLCRDRQTRLAISVLEHATASLGLAYSAQDIEWFVANLIYKGYIKGYIAHERGILVLSAKDPFPQLASFIAPT